MNCFPAEPGTWLIDLDPDVEPIPIIGWAASGLTAAPILPTQADPVSGQAYRLPGTGAVVDPAWSRTFESDDAWRAAAGRSMPYEPGSSLLFGVETKKPSKPTKATASAPVSGFVIELTEDVASRLKLGNKRLKNRSFWHYTDGPEAVFEIEGGKLLPVNDEVDKITRDKFFELRKDVTVIQIDPDNLPTGEEPDADGEDDDDTGGLI